MMKFNIDTTVDAAAELEAFLNYNGIEYRVSEGRYKLIFSSRGFKWETDCVCRERAVLIYGIYPFPAGDRAYALSLCSKINSRVLYGGMFIQDDTVVFRTGADLFDSYSAYESIGRAIDYNARVMTEFWHKMAVCS